MAPVPPHATRRLAFAAAAAALALAAPPAHALRFVNYNLMFYPSVNVSGRNPYFRRVMLPLGADLMTVQEMGSAAGVDSFRLDVLNVNEPGQWSAASFTDGNDSDNMLYYKPSKVTLLGQRNFYVSVDQTRFINEYRIRPVGYTSSAADLYIYSVHLKAGTSAPDSAQRSRECAGLRDTLNRLPPGSNVIVTGDFNFYRSVEPGLQGLLSSQPDNDGRLYDPLNLIGTWQDNAAFAAYHTQCPSTTAYRPSGSYSGGGIDDRFDLFLPTYSMNDGEGLDLLTSTYITVGNDGQHLNKSVTDAPIAPADTAYARGLWWASDHMPVRVDLQLPAKVGASASPIALGTAIVGGSLSKELVVSNPAAPPADTLEYSYAPPAGFTAPAGVISLLPGGISTDAIGLNTSTAGVKSGSLTLTSNDLDTPALGIPLSGTVLRHAVPSLDSVSVVVSDTLDFGTHPAGEFQPVSFRVHNQGYDALQARLGLGGVGMSDGVHFSFSPGYTGDLLSGVGRTYSLVFDDASANPDSTYESLVSVSTNDGESYPGASPLPWLNLLLRARKSSGSTGVPGDFTPTLTRLLPPSPNPLVAMSRVGFDLARPGRASLEVFDLAGRRVAGFTSGWHDAGRYQFSWSGRDGRGGSLGAGLYFVRFTTPGLVTQTARLVIVR